MSYTHLKIETLTPLHIGSGRTLQGNTEYLYFERQRTVAVVDERKVLNIIGEENLDAWVNLIGRGGDLLDYLQQRKPGIQPDDTGRRFLPVLGRRAPGGNQTVREQLFSGNGEPILPGSSLKGAVRTAVFNRMVEGNPSAARQIASFKVVTEKPDYRSGGVKRVPKYNGSKLEGAYFGSDPNHDVFRLLRIGDAHFSETVCLLAETLNETGNGFGMKDSVKQFIECIPAGAETLCRVQIPPDLKKQIARFDDVAFKMKQRDRMEWPKLIADINANTKRLIQSEVTRYQAENLPKEASLYLEELQKRLVDLNSNECIIRVGFGTGYLNMTGGWPLEQWRGIAGVDYEKEMADLGEAVRHRKGYEGFQLPKSRKMVLDGVPLGFLKLTLLTAEQSKVWEAETPEERKQRHQKERIFEETRLLELAEKQAAEEAELKKPDVFTEELEVGTPVQAVISQRTKPHSKVRLSATAQPDNEVAMVGLKFADVPAEGTTVFVRVTQLKEGIVKEVRFEGIK